MTYDDETIREQVRAGYGAVAVSESGCSSSGCCTAPVDATQFAQRIGYTLEQLAALPDGANMGLSCGNPEALASLQPGEVVLDLGSGGGFGVFIAARKVGARGRAIGVDMTPEMLAKARRNIAAHRERTGLDNVEFRLGEIEHLPVADGSVDVVISNCVLNLSPDKPQVWREIARVLRPGGRVAISDLALLRPLPESVRADVEALVGCVAGAALVSETEAMMRAAALMDIQLEPSNGYVDLMSSSSDPMYQRIAEQLEAGTSASDYVVSAAISARKPMKQGCCG